MDGATSVQGARSRCWRLEAVTKTGLVVMNAFADELGGEEDPDCRNALGVHQHVRHELRRQAAASRNVALLGEAGVATNRPPARSLRGVSLREHPVVVVINHAGRARDELRARARHGRVPSP